MSQASARPNTGAAVIFHHHRNRHHGWNVGFPECRPRPNRRPTITRQPSLADQKSWWRLSASCANPAFPDIPLQWHWSNGLNKFSNILMRPLFLSSDKSKLLLQLILQKAITQCALSKNTTLKNLLFRQQQQKNGLEKSRVLETKKNLPDPIRIGREKNEVHVSMFGFYLKVDLKPSGDLFDASKLNSGILLKLTSTMWNSLRRNSVHLF